VANSGLRDQSRAGAAVWVDFLQAHAAGLHTESFGQLVLRRSPSEAHGVGDFAALLDLCPCRRTP
jgi:hypothetical protein